MTDIKRSEAVDDILTRAKNAGFILDLPSQAKDTTPLIILLGWLGCQDRWLSKYAAFLAEEGYPSVRAILPPTAVFWPVSSPRRQYATDLLDFISVVDSGCPDRPIVFYTFSNGGAFVLEQIAHILADQSHKDTSHLLIKRNTESSSEDVPPRVQICGTIFDSSPCFMHVSSGARAIGEGKPFVTRCLLGAVFFLAIFLGKIVDPFRPRTFWETMTKLLPKVPALYLYSADDPLCDAIKLDELVNARMKAGCKVTAVKWEISEHVGHFRCHPETYRKSVLKFLKKCVVAA